MVSIGAMYTNGNDFPVDYHSRRKKLPRACEDSVCMEEMFEGKREPELGKLESSSAGMGLEAPGQQCLSNWEIGRTNVDGCLLVDGGSKFGGHHFFLRRTRYWDATRYPKFNIVCLIKNSFPADELQTRKHNGAGQQRKYPV